MKVRNIFVLILSVLVLLLAVGSGLASGPQPTGSSEAVGVNASPGANAPWFNIEVDTPGSTGQYTSVAIDPSNGGTYVSYYDATNKTLRMAMNHGFGVGNCGPNNSWLCQTIDSTYGVGKYSSIAINPVSGEIGISYYDATNGKLKFAHAEICPTCSWSIDTVDETLGFGVVTGKYASLQYLSDGTPYIAYHFENPGNVDALMLASYVGDGSGNCANNAIVDWQCDTIQIGEGVGQFASLALDGSDRPRIAYYDGGNDALM